MTVRPVADGGRFAGSLRVPPSKSVTNRVLNLALLARAPIEIQHPLVADDTARMRDALESLGFETATTETTLELRPGPLPDSVSIDCGASGTMARFLTASLTTLPGEWRLDGVKRLRERPIAPLLATLRQLGARVECLDNEGFLPLRILGGSLGGTLGETAAAGRVDASDSSQYLSAVLMALTRSSRPCDLEVDGLTSGPYIELTLQALSSFGGRVEKLPSGGFRVFPGLSAPARCEVEGDFSSAAYFAAAAALADGRVELRGLNASSAQGDRDFLRLLEEMGAAVDWSEPDRLVVSGSGHLQGIDVDMSRMPDQVPTLAAIAPFASGKTQIRNVAHLRIKESDRLAACAGELLRLGASVTERDDGLEILGSWADAEPPREIVNVATHGDHRIAMSFSVLGLRRGGVRIDSPEVVAKSYPRFWEDFESCLDP